VGRALESWLIQRAPEFVPRDRHRAHQGGRFARTLKPAELDRDSESVTRLLYERLSDEEVAEVVRRVAETPELADCLPIGNDLATRRWLVLAYGTWLKLPFVIERTGLTPDQPPEAVHAMARGPLAAAGGLGEADMVVDAVASVGGRLADAGDALDFGCSSGRVVRVLAAAFPEIRWRGCDPNGPAVTWAAEHLKDIEFFVSPQHPPLPIAEGQLGLVYAISIWSHFAPELGLRWFDEMHRVLRPGGYFVLTTHGLQSVSHYAELGQRSPHQSRAILDGLYRSGYWYAPEFGDAGDSGIVNPEWGTAFLSPEWLLTKLCPRWRVLEFAPGRNQLNQDVYVLQRA
jgi:SAM-dependent methyltransferase